MITFFCCTCTTDPGYPTSSQVPFASHPPKQTFSIQPIASASPPTAPQINTAPPTIFPPPLRRQIGLFHLISFSSAMQSQSQPLLPVHRRDASHDFNNDHFVLDHLAPSKTSLKICFVLFVVMALGLPLLSFISELFTRILADRLPFGASIAELHHRASYKYAAVS